MSYYSYITKKREDPAELKTVMEAVTDDILKYSTDEIKPGVLLGLIQSGKTRTFIGVIAKCFDSGFDVSIVFTKNSVALVEQTMRRLKSEFEMPVERNKLFIWDVIKLQNMEQLTGYVLSNKIILVVKKEYRNMEKLHELVDNTELKNKRILIVDDEADQASVSFKADKTKDEGIDMAKIASSLSHLRQKLSKRCSFLQVTATPYSLYLQPEEIEINGDEFAPIRPAFTHVLKPHPFYVGGKYYFEDSLDGSSPSSYVHVQLPEDELSFINSKSKTTANYNRKVLNNIFGTEKLSTFRKAIINFIVGGTIRQLQETSDDFWAPNYHCAFVLHTATTKAIHRMQKNLVELFVDELTGLNDADLKKILKSSYHSLAFSIQASGLEVPDYAAVYDSVKSALKNQHVGIVEVNSENQVAELLGEDGQLRLDNPFNIFVGGQSLDRGITIDHLIGFFYGRNPGRFQMDTVLQHSRMYGSRSKEDLAVTRFYTSARIYEAMRSMHWFDRDLRENILNDLSDPTKATAHFIAKQGNTIVPAGPNKLKASNLISFKGHSRLLPVGFQTGPKSSIEKAILEIDSIIESHINGEQSEFLLHKDEAIAIIEKIDSTFVYGARFNNAGLDWDILPFVKALELGTKHSGRDDIYVYVKTGRQIGRLKHNGESFTDAPDDGKTDLPHCRNLAAHRPVLMLLKQRGREEDGWRGTPFYWPVLVMPREMPNYIYCED